MSLFDYDQMSEKDLHSSLLDAPLEDQLEIWERLFDFAWGRQEYGSASAIAQTIYELAIKTDSPSVARKAKYSQGSALFNINEFESARDSYLQSADLAAEEGMQTNLADALWAAADSCFSVRDYERSLELSQNSETIAAADENWLIAGRAASIRMKSLYLLDREDEALDAAAEARNHFRKIAEIQEVARIDDYTITILLYLNRIDAAVDLARDVLLKWTIQQDLERIAYSHYRLGIALKRQGNSQESNTYLETAKARYLEADRIGRVAECEQEIAENLFDLGQYEEAIERFLSARSMWDGVGNDWGATRCDATRAVCLHMLDKNLEAKRLNLRILSAIEDIPEERYQDMSYLVRARAADNALNDENYEEVLTILNESPELGSFVPSTHLVIWRLTLQARALYELGREDEALVAANSAMELTDEDLLNWNSGFIYEIRGKVLLHKNKRQGEIDLAHAIALHLANGYTETATELSRIFIPKIQRSDVDAFSEGEEVDPSGEFATS